MFTILSLLFIIRLKLKNNYNGFTHPIVDVEENDGGERRSVVEHGTAEKGTVPGHNTVPINGC